MPPDNGSQWEEFEAALDALRTASSQDNTKGARIREWFKKYTGKDPAVSFITENKQIGNRFKEQKGKNAPYTVFFFVDETLVERVRNRISEYVYPDLECVFFVTWDEDQQSYSLQIVLAANGELDTFAKAIVDHFGASVEALPASASSMSGSSTSPSVVSAPTIANDPCGLVDMRGVLAQAVASLQAGKHVLLIGPPGTAKSEAAECICRLLGVDSEVVVATAEWTTFETLGGYFQVPQEDGSSVIDYVPGVVTRAMLSNKWLIVDEFNRADMDKAFGELFAVLVGKTVKLPYFKRIDGELVSVVVGKNANADDGYAIVCPNDWRLVACMNSFDKASLSKLSLALMRRFAVVYVDLPEESAYARLLADEANKLVAGLEPQALKALQECSQIAIQLFAAKANSLREANVGTGAAIPLDIIRYIRKRLDAEPNADPRDLMVEALEQYLFPQYEGKDDAHEQIVNTLMAALGENDVRRQKLSEVLAIYTGFRWSR